MIFRAFKLVLLSIITKYNPGHKKSYDNIFFSVFSKNKGYFLIKYAFIYHSKFLAFL